jgi:hypothetical protein
MAARPAVGLPTGEQVPETVSDWLGKVAGPIAHVLRRGVRSSDLVTRTGEARFQLLLPESTELAAAALGERLAVDCEVWLTAIGAPLAVDVAVAPLTPDTPAEDVVARAWSLLEER